jgi:hypothetical protein
MQIPLTSVCLFLLKFLHTPPRTRLSFLTRTTILPSPPRRRRTRACRTAWPPCSRWASSRCCCSTASSATTSDRRPHLCPDELSDRTPRYNCACACACVGPWRGPSTAAQPPIPTAWAYDTRPRRCSAASDDAAHRPIAHAVPRGGGAPAAAPQRMLASAAAHARCRSMLSSAARSSAASCRTEPQSTLRHRSSSSCFRRRAEEQRRRTKPQCMLAARAHSHEAAAHARRRRRGPAVLSTRGSPSPEYEPGEAQTLMQGAVPADVLRRLEEPRGRTEERRLEERRRS